VTDLAALIGIGDCAALKARHGGECLGHGFRQAVEMGLLKTHAAGIQPKAQGWVMPEQLTETLPEPSGVMAIQGRKRCHGPSGRLGEPSNRIQATGRSARDRNALSGWTDTRPRQPPLGLC